MIENKFNILSNQLLTPTSYKAPPRQAAEEMRSWRRPSRRQRDKTAPDGGALPDGEVATNGDVPTGDHRPLGAAPEGGLKPFDDVAGVQDPRRGSNLPPLSPSQLQSFAAFPM